jgi:hypothetical protein
MDGMQVDFGDGVSALERVTRSIVIMTSQAIEQLKEGGYDRSRVQIDVSEEGLPVSLKLDGERVFEISAVEKDGVVLVRGEWLRQIKRKRSFWDWLLRRK